MMNQKIELIVAGQCSMMSEMSRGLCTRSVPGSERAQVSLVATKGSCVSGIGMAR